MGAMPSIATLVSCFFLSFRIPRSPNRNHNEKLRLFNAINSSYHLFLSTLPLLASNGAIE